VNSEELQEAYVSYVNETDRDNTPIFYDLFDELAAEIHPVNVEKGFWGPPVMMDKYVAKLALIHSEVTEILEALRKSQGSDKVTEEFADVLIRTYDLYGELVNAGEADPELYAVMMKKIETNKTRPAKHGNRWG
jgi:NTP pyrophosphatase (non-canonical NTP hydrolase)